MPNGVYMGSPLSVAPAIAKKREAGLSMSIALMSKVWKTRCASHTQKLVLLALADNANDEGRCWPSVGNIALKCDLSERSVQYEVRKLTQAGLLAVKINRGRTHSNRYHLLLEKGANCAPIKLKGANHDMEKVQTTTLKGARLAPEPSGTIREPSEGAPKYFAGELERLIQTAKKEMDSLLCRGALEHSIDGLKWHNHEYEAQWHQWAARLKDLKRQLRLGLVK